MTNKHITLSHIRVLIRGGGDLASGVAWRLHNCGFKVLVTEVAMPLAVRRRVSFCEAVYEGSSQVEGVTARLVQTPDQATALWKDGVIPVIVDPECASLSTIKPEVLVDAIMAKRNTGTSIGDAPLVIALGPGFQAGVDAHFVVETQRGHYLGRLITEGPAAPDSGIPGKVMGIGAERVIRAPAAGRWESAKEIGDTVKKGELVGYVAGVEVKASIAGAIRGLIHPGITVPQGLKIGDIDPRGVVDHCFTISEKSLAIAGGVLEGILRTYAN
ncbi:MAG: EF2563 family selenium-dependent molybdenum hydroxylase system protein [Deltaproteobacteria bacterium]|nr:EF2563 family selenium-dependent molybdenum hydroxylase system protein [Deltaproteobacteria bacterium]MBW1928182.1 EF2563 family selenium-dependent molybdenum hydroxylase system protein [Deltaproteobacteria bacterium]MBW2025425.1 EF2563 family selenium-dependent molybdenum hydroxylase system protein [Deltaproteobacteria bacterium]MBW2125938.1 EF2563 family selenium-dependent molybdenum hydroxylase system protein [Deltaproteobacteria bacterium]RLB14098.1 MAG: EF2563 family selenium-dependent 